MDQQSPEWYAARLGKITASKIADVCARTQKGYGASRENYMAQLIVERLTGQPASTYVNAEMQWGTETEPLARDAYEFYRDVDVEQVGFIPHPTIPDSGASPDGLVGDVGLVEIKCPNTATHISTLLGDAISGRYIHQMQWQMACTQRQWCDFVSFDPRMPPRMRLFVKRIARDEALLGQITREVALFLREMQTKLATLRSEYEEAA